MSNYTSTRFSEEFVARIRGQIARFDVNQEHLALIAGVSQSQLSKIIRGVRPMTLDQAAVICEALNISFEGLVREVEEFISHELTYSSPVRFVDEGRRLAAPERHPNERLDHWGVTYGIDWDLEMDVSGSSEDEAPDQQSEYGKAAKRRSKNRGEISS